MENKIEEEWEKLMVTNSPLYNLLRSWWEESKGDTQYGK